MSKFVCEVIKGHQIRVACVVQTRSEVRGPRSGLGEGDGAVALVVKLL